MVFQPATVDQICETYLPYADRIRPYIVESSSSSTKSLRLARIFSLRVLRQPCLILTTAPIHLSPLLTAPLVARLLVPRYPTRLTAFWVLQRLTLTRASSGPFPTELFFDETRSSGEVGHEYGVTTTAAVYDVVGNYAARINGLTDLAITKLLDVLGCLDD